MARPSPSMLINSTSFGRRAHATFRIHLRPILMMIVALSFLAILLAHTPAASAAAAAGTPKGKNTNCKPVAAARKPARPRPTKAQLKAEVKKMVTNITKYYPQYSKYAKDLNKYINLAFSSKYDLSALKDATILIPSNAAAQTLSKRLPATSRNIPKAYNITAYAIISKRYILPQFRTMAAGQKVGTQLRQPIFKVTPRNSKVVAFARQRSAPRRMWSTIRIPRMYAGPYFIAHGVNLFQIPINTKV